MNVQLQIQGDTFQVHYDSSDATICLKGKLRPNSPEDCAPVLNVLKTIAEAETKVIILDLSELDFLNSTAIDGLSGFVSHVHDLRCDHLVVRGSKRSVAQTKLFSILNRIMPTLQVELV